MFKNLLPAIALIAVSVCAQAQEKGVGFYAPSVNGTSNTGTPEQGAIVYDLSTSTFQGNAGTSTSPAWTTLGATISKAPTIQTFTSGSTYTRPTPSPLYIRVKMVGGGGGGGSNSSNGFHGTATTFGTNLLSAGGGAGAVVGGGGGSGGVFLVNSPAVKVVAYTGSGGSSSIQWTLPSGGIATYGSTGGASPFGGGGASSGNASGNGAGGGGANTSTLSTGQGGGGGGAGAYVEAIIPSPDTSYPYSIGTPGAGATGAGQGSAGVIIVEEYYQ